jgi:hypothetical protein
MVERDKLQEIIRNRICCVLAHGASLKDLESHVHLFANRDVCWTSLNYFVPVESLLSAIDKRLDIVYDSATVVPQYFETYEKEWRIPRLEGFLKRPDNNLWITSWGIIRDTINGLQLFDFYERYKNKTLIVDHLFPEGQVRNDAMNVPNSICLLIAALIAGKAKGIVLFGLDGYSITNTNTIKSYYKSEELSEEHIRATGKIGKTMLYRDTQAFEEKFPSLLEKYCKLFDNNISLINCSHSVYTCIPKISYEGLEKALTVLEET